MFVFLPHPWRCDAVFRLVPDSIAYLGSYELPLKLAFLLLVYPSYLFNDVHTWPAFEQDEFEGRWGRSYQDADHHL